jgi:hypothetical protein
MYFFKFKIYYYIIINYFILYIYKKYKYLINLNIYILLIKNISIFLSNLY